MSKTIKTMDANEAVAYVSYPFTEIAAIYPITPSSPMAEKVDEWSSQGKKNFFGQSVKLIEMQSEAGAVGTLHGALEAGALAVSYTSSQGLLLMIPTLYRLSGQLKPCVLHIAARTVMTHSSSIFGDHSDVMACRQTGVAMLFSGSVQDAMDLAAVSHLSTIKGSIPVMHCFDGFRTSHEVQKIECLEYEDLEKMIDQNALTAFRKNSLNPERPVMRSSVQGPEIYFQHREACNQYYDNFPKIVEEYMNKINALSGRNYKLFNYYGAPDAAYVIVAMGSISGPVMEVVDHLNAKGEKVGFLQVHLYRPFSMKHFMSELPKSVKKLAVLDRTKEPGAAGDPLYEDVCTSFVEAEAVCKIFAGRYGLSSKDVSPAQIISVFDNLKQQHPKNHFTIGITDDVTHLSLEVGDSIDLTPDGTVNCKFWGLASDGTVGANKNSVKIIGDKTSLFVQAYFEYDAKKSGGITKSHLRFSKHPIRSSYLVEKADFIACHNPSYLDKYNITSELKPGSIFLLNCSWSIGDLDALLPARVKKYLAENNINFYIIDATAIAKSLNLGNRVNTVLQAAFFKLVNVIPIDDAINYMKEYIGETYGKRGENVVHKNCAAVDMGVEKVTAITIPDRWKSIKLEPVATPSGLSDFIKNVVLPCNAQNGNEVPVSALVAVADGTVPLGTTQHEKRGIAINVPVWNRDKCIQCNQCSFVCPHAAIRPYLIDKEEEQKAPVGFLMASGKGKEFKEYQYRIQVSVLDCTGCGNCINVCPAKQNALTMEPLSTQLQEMDNWEFANSLSKKVNPLDIGTIKGSQFEKPLMEFPGACAGCGETPYAKLVTQLYGDRMYIANAIGCSQAWGGYFPSFPYTVDEKGHGPAWSASLFENNGEFGLGMCLAVNILRGRLEFKAKRLQAIADDWALKSSLANWLNVFSDGRESRSASAALKETLTNTILDGEAQDIKEFILGNAEYLIKKSIWMYGGDGWAYDIGAGGLDHVMSLGEDVNIIIFDTEVYSNTGGQSSKATPLGAIAQFAAAGKRSKKKDLGIMAITYGNVYVAQVSMGADKKQLLTAITEAENYPGTSVIIAYAPCICHGIKTGMDSSNQEAKRAVDAGYWHLYRYNPLLKEQGKNPFNLDSKKPSLDFLDFLRGEDRFAQLERAFPEKAKEIFSVAQKEANEKYNRLVYFAKNGF